MVGAAAGTLGTYFGQMGTGFFRADSIRYLQSLFHWLVGLVGVPGDPCFDSYLEREIWRRLNFTR